MGRFASATPEYETALMTAQAIGPSTTILDFGSGVERKKRHGGCHALVECWLGPLRIIFGYGGAAPLFDCDSAVAIPTNAYAFSEGEDRLRAHRNVCSVRPAFA
jgi:hypothetical protein